MLYNIVLVSNIQQCKWDLTIYIYNFCNAEDPDLIPEWGRSPVERHGNALQYSYLENPMDRGAWQAIVHRIAKSQTWLKQCVCVCVCVISWASLQPHAPSHSSRSSQCQTGLPVLYSSFPLAIYFTHGIAYVSMLLSQFVLFSPSPTVSTSLFTTSVSQFLPCR